MAITTIKSNAVDPSLLGTGVLTTQPHRVMGKTSVIFFEATQVGAGDIGSLVDLAKIPGGNCTILADQCKIYNSAFGASRTLTVGLSAYKKAGDSSATAADYEVLHTTADVATAGSFVPSSATTAGNIAIKAVTEVKVVAKVAGGTIPDGATLKGYITIVTAG